MNDSLTLAQALSNFHFLRPFWLLALLPALWFLWRIWRHHAASTAWQNAIDPQLLPYLLDEQHQRRQRGPLLLLCLAWLLGTVALAGPTWDRIQYPAQQAQDALVLVVDQSEAMYAQDHNPNRQTVVRRKLIDILDARTEGQTGLVVYAGQAHMVTPLTEDSNPIRNMIPALSPNIMPAAGNNPAHGVELALGLLGESRGGIGRILLITGDLSNEQSRLIAELMADTPYTLSVIGVGSERGGTIPVAGGDVLRDGSGNAITPRLNRPQLQQLARDNGGRYHDLTLSNADIDHVLSGALLAAEMEYLDTDQEYDVWNDAGPWLVLLLLPLGALAFRRGWLLGITLASSITLLTLIPATPAHAQDLRSLWQTRDQQGARAFAEDDPGRAAQLFESAPWRGTAHYRAGDYQAAAEYFAQGEDADSFYNLGNALAYSNMLEQAIAAYDAALAIEPDHEDALHNKRILEDLLEQQEQEQETESDQSEESDEDQDDQDQDEQDDSEADDEQDEQLEDQQDDSMDPDDQESDEEPDADEQESDDDGSQDQDQMDIEEIEDQESLEQWLRRIEDNPGELLERKFRFEFRRRQMQARNTGR